MSFEKTLEEDRRLVILLLLSKQGDWALNEYVLQVGLQQMAHSASMARVHSDIDWLEEQGLVKLSKGYADVRIITLTQRGLDVATGQATCTGVKRPGPSA